MIKPTIGRVVCLYFYGKTQVDAGEQPYAAIIAHVLSDEQVNLAYFDANGVARNLTAVTLYQGEGEHPEGSFAMWMPYQIGQAKAAAEVK